MQFSIASIVSFGSCCVSLINALPLNSHRDIQQAKQKRYSVVPVDGSTPTASSTAGPVTVIKTVIQNTESTKTVTFTPSTVAAATETITAIISEFGSAITVVVTVTKDTPTATTSILVVDPQPTESATMTFGHGPIHISTFASLPSPTSSSTLPSSTIAPTSPSYSVPSLIWSTIPAPTTTSYDLPSTSTTKTYDDGQWHTTYPSWNATSTSNFTTSTLFPSGYTP